MKRIAFAALCLGSLGLAACGGGDDDGGDVVDLPDAMPVAQLCDPVAQSGCADTEKCTSVIESFADPVLSRTACVPNGTIAEGEVCARDETTGVDNCASGTWCVNNGTDARCETICGVGAKTCGEKRACVGFDGIFNDVMNVGFCQPGCDPITRTADCQTGEGCYTILTTGESTCGAPANALQTDNCENPAIAGSQGCSCLFLNGCGVGYGCSLQNVPNVSGSVCTFYCDPTGAGGPSCDDSVAAQSDVDGPGAGYSCRQLSTYYNNTTQIPDTIGMCINPAVVENCFGCVDPTQPNCDPTKPPCCDDGTVTPENPADDCPVP